ncbi:MAG TPA: ferric reductase-like transmembrane domain-containing protein [Candidatus Saccharimonadales bacterium]|jgi:hypothetical protein|nr:ferric reductase-like transmembrane domain-containing protein [Candidatus Saccharimonadales bacterium]
MISSLPFFASSTVQIATQRVETSWEWYVIRAAGFVAAGLLLLLMISGIGQVTGLTYRLIEPVKAWMIHKAMALALCAAIFIHVFFLVVDHFIIFSIPQVAVPFLSHYNNGTTFMGLALGNLAVTFGILAMYGIVIIVLSSLGWIDTHKKIWRWLHYTGYAVILLVFLHGIFIGSDLKYGTFRLLWVLAGLILVLAIISRLRYAGSLKDGSK